MRFHRPLIRAAHASRYGLPGGDFGAPAPNNFIPYIGLRKSGGGASATGDARLDNALRAACYSAGGLVAGANEGQCKEDPNYKQCLRVSFRNGVALRQSPCRNTQAVAAEAPTGSVLCGSAKTHRSSCGEPYVYTYVAFENRVAGYIMAFDPVTSTATVVPCTNNG